MRAKIMTGLAVLATAAGMMAGAAWHAAAAAAAPSAERTAAAPAYSVALAGVACTSVRNCFAAAYISYTTSQTSTAPLVERWNGTKWLLSTAPLPPGGKNGVFRSITCPSATECVAVGSYFTATSTAIPLAEVWHGKSWAPAAVPSGPTAAKSGLELTGISCGSATSCAAIGISYATYSPVAYRWDGKKFAQVTLPSPAKGAQFSIDSVSCASASRCVAVGGFTLNKGYDTAFLAEIWNGKTWTPVRLSSVGTPRELLAVDCATAARCVATGDYVTPAGWRSYASVLTGSTWKGAALAPAAKGDEFLDGLSCFSATDCVATGATEAEVPYEGSGIAYAETWNGKAWSVSKVPALPGAKGPGSDVGSSLDAVSCPAASYCLATGTAGPVIKGVSAVWTGKAWKQEALAAS